MTTIRRAKATDVRQIHALVREYPGIVLDKATVALYEDVQEFWVAERDGVIAGCGALHVMWEDLAEVRTVVVHQSFRKQGIGHQILAQLLETARTVGVQRVFVLTFETTFFGHHGFVELDGTPVPQDVYAELLRSYDEGVAEFLDLERVKPNTLGNTRMLCIL